MALPGITHRTTGDQVAPNILPSVSPWDFVVDIQDDSRGLPAAVLTGKSVPLEDLHSQSWFYFCGILHIGLVVCHKTAPESIAFVQGCQMAPLAMFAFSAMNNPPKAGRQHNSRSSPPRKRPWAGAFSAYFFPRSNGEKIRQSASGMGPSPSVSLVFPALPCWTSHACLM